MCFSEFIKEQDVSHPIQFFASDIDETAIEKARQGLYPENILQDVSPERIRRFFVKTEHGYQISKPIRELCIFARQNLIKDPPFSKMDLISCRNLMIYFGPLLQKRRSRSCTMPSIRPVISCWESPSPSASLRTFFSGRQKQQDLFQKTSSSELHFDGERGQVREKAAVKKKAEEPAAGGTDIQKEADNIILNRYSPAGLVINEDMDILQFRGNITPI